jgi:hypothetical protein
MKVNVRVAKGAAGYGVAADTNGSDGTDRAENLEQETLVDIGREITNVKRGRLKRIVASSRGGGDGDRGFGGRIFVANVSRNGS